MSSVHCKCCRAGAALLAIAFALCAAPAIAQSNIGSTTFIKNIVQGVRGTVTRSLAPDANVFSE